MTDYSEIVKENISLLRDQIQYQLGRPSFDWPLLIEAIIEEGSPLKDIFVQELVRQAEICDAAIKLNESVRRRETPDSLEDSEQVKQIGENDA
jgi:hypothetical protein